jgi:hypothetical protein
MKIENPNLLHFFLSVLPFTSTMPKLILRENHPFFLREKSLFFKKKGLFVGISQSFFFKDKLEHKNTTRIIDEGQHYFTCSKWITFS